jgi:hypothetical protein
MYAKCRSSTRLGMVIECSDDLGGFPIPRFQSSLSARAYLVFDPQRLFCSSFSIMRVPFFTKYSVVAQNEDGVPLSSKQRPFCAKLLSLCLCFIVGSLGYFAAEAAANIHLKNESLHRECEIRY